MEDSKEPAEQVPNAAARREKLNRHNTVPLLGVNDKGNGEINILMEGYVWKQSGMLKKWKKKKLRLLPQQLIYFDDSTSEQGKIRAMALVGCNVVPAYPTIDVEPNSKDVAKLRKSTAFKVQVKKGDFIFSAETMQARDNWINAIRNRDKISKDPNRVSSPVPKIATPDIGRNSEAKEDVTLGEDHVVYQGQEDEGGSASSPTPKRMSVQFANTPVEIPDHGDSNGRQEEVPTDGYTHDEVDQEVMAVMEKYNEQSVSDSRKSSGPNQPHGVLKNVTASSPPVQHRHSQSYIPLAPQVKSPVQQRHSQPNMQIPAYLTASSPPAQRAASPAPTASNQSSPPVPHKSLNQTNTQTPPQNSPANSPLLQHRPSQATLTVPHNVTASNQHLTASPAPAQQRPASQPSAQPLFSPPGPQTSTEKIPPIQKYQQPPLTRSQQQPRSQQQSQNQTQVPQIPQISQISQISQLSQNSQSPQTSPPQQTQSSPQHSPKSSPHRTSLTLGSSPLKAAQLQPQLPIEPQSQTLPSSFSASNIPEGTPLRIDTLQALAENTLTPPKNRGSSDNFPNIKEGHEHFDAEEDDWNNKYQSLVENSDHTFDKAVALGLKLNGFIGSFLAAAKTYATIIVDEFHLPPHQKTIPPLPVDSDVPAEAREEMYIRNGILFRFAIDNTGELNDTSAMKVAGHELKGIKAVMQTNVRGLSTALTCSIDYKGFRVVAIAIFPADGDRTMVYGIMPSLVRIDDEVKRALKSVGSSLNLKDHVIMVDSSRPLTIPASAIVSAHS